MKIRTKLLVGYAGFVLALGVLGAWSARTLSQMSAVSGRIISENYDSVVAAQDMKESLERQDSAALFDLLGEHQRARRQIAEHRARFDAALTKAAANITERGEPEQIEAIRHSRDEYYRRLDAFLTAAAATKSRYFDSLEPQFNEVRSQADALLHLNQEAMRRKADEASQIARRWSFVTLALALALMAAGIAVEVGLSNRGPNRSVAASKT
jgi:NtrC-family two-component system sensor histidine kinase KinB